MLVYDNHDIAKKNGVDTQNRIGVNDGQKWDTWKRFALQCGSFFGVSSLTMLDTRNWYQSVIQWAKKWDKRKQNIKKVKLNLTDGIIFVSKFL